MCATPHSEVKINSKQNNRFSLNNHKNWVIIIIIKQIKIMYVNEWTTTIEQEIKYG